MSSRPWTGRGGVAGLVIAVAITGCTGDDPMETTSTSARAASVTTVAEPVEAPDDSLPPPEETVVASVPSGEILVEGLPIIEVLSPPESEAGEVPMFSWSPVDGTSTYDVVVLSPDAPIWAWRGEQTEVWLGGLPFERPEGMAGAVLGPGSCWSVLALDAEGQMIAASAFLPVSPGESSDHACEPGRGSTYGS